MHPFNTKSKLTALIIAAALLLAAPIASAAPSDRAPGSNQQQHARVKGQSTASRLQRVVRHYNGKTFQKGGKTWVGLQTSRNASTYLKNLSPNMVEFFITPGFHHLYMRIGGKTYSRISGLSESNWYNSNSERVSVLCKLNDREMTSLKDYVGRAVNDPNGVLGPFNYGGGAPPRASNCTSYITNAPVGDNGQSLARILGVGASGYPQGFVSALMGSSSSKVKAVIVHNPTRTFNASYPINLD